MTGFDSSGSNLFSRVVEAMGPDHAKIMALVELRKSFANAQQRQPQHTPDIIFSVLAISAIVAYVPFSSISHPTQHPDDRLTLVLFRRNDIQDWCYRDVRPPLCG